MAYTTINKHTDYFNTKLYSGNGSTNAITGVGFAPNFVWIKERSSTSSHVLGTTIQGTGKRLSSNTTDAEASLSNIFTSFDSDGFTHGADNGVNESGQTYVSWNWKANGAGSSNTDGSITSTVSANQTAGFSIVKWSGNAVNNSSIGHGLGVQPEMIIVKAINKVDNWCVYHKSVALNGSSFLRLHTTDASYNAFVAFTGEPTSSVFYVSDAAATNQTSYDYIAYCFASITGYSKLGSYTGNGNADGPFVYTGFKPAFILFKHSGGGTAAGEHWRLRDNKRDPFNVGQKDLYANLNYAEATSGGGTDYDILSNGFKMRGLDNAQNNTGATYIYMAFGQSLVGSNNVPCTAR
jgi:hypothetical protein